MTDEQKQKIKNYRKEYYKKYYIEKRLAIKEYKYVILVNSGYNNNYVQYESKGDRILSIREYFSLIEKYLRELINQYKNQGEWELQLTAEINSILLKPGSY